MAYIEESIDEELQTISEGRYGKDVRKAIHDAIEKTKDAADDAGGVAANALLKIGVDERIIKQNSDDIAALKNNPSGLILTSSSPLPNCSASSIVGIDVDGCSTQDTTYGFSYVQGNISVNVGNAINQALTSQSAIRCTSDIKQFASGVSFTCTSGYEVIVAYATSASGNIESIINWCTSFTTSASGYYRIVVRKASGANIVPSEAETVFVPTPTNPIAIVDASGEVVAHTVNLTDKQTTGSNLALPKPLPIGTYTISFETDMESNSFRLSNSTDTSKDSISSGSRVSLGNNRYAITLTTTFESNYYSTNANGGTYVKNIMIEQGTTASDYVAYASNKITLPTLRSVGTVKDELIVNADGSGQIVRRVGVLNLKNCTFEYYGEYNNGYLFYYDAIADAKRVDTAILSMCEYFTCVPNSQWSSMSSGQYRVKTDDGRIYANSADKTTKAQFNSWLQGLDHCYLYYVKATPTTTTLTASEVSAIRALKTYNGTTIIDSALDVKSVTYHADTKKYIDDKFAYVSDEVCIGSWMGNPLYRRCFEVVYSGGSTLVIDLGEEITLINLSGAVNEGDRQYSINGGDSTSAWVESDSLVINAMASTNPIRIILEYLKVNDESTISVLSDDSEYYGQIETPDDDVVVGVITEG